VHALSACCADKCSRFRLSLKLHRRGTVRLNISINKERSVPMNLFCSRITHHFSSMYYPACSLLCACSLFYQGINSRTVPVRILSRKIRDADCDELNCRAAWFGFALSAAGDLDQDGYQGKLRSTIRLEYNGIFYFRQHGP